MPNSKSCRRFHQGAALPLVFLFLAGCATNDSAPREAAKPLAGVKLTLVVVDDPAIATAIRGLRDEWNAQTGSEVEVIETRTPPQKPGDGKESPTADALICPAYLLGPLAEAKRLAAVPPAITRDPQGPWSQTFELLRNQDAVWSNEIYGVPLGSPVFCCYCRADVLEKLHRKPPQTWSEYIEVARLVREAGVKAGRLGAGSVKYAAVEPLGRGSAGLVLLARAAAYAKQRDNYTTLFDEKTLEPAIDGPPFVRALEELVAAAKLGPAEELDFDPAQARAEFWNGAAAMAISWPTGSKSTKGAATKKADGSPAAGAVPARSASSPLPATIAELPGAAEVFRPSSGTWEPRSEEEGRHVPLLGVAGRMGVVLAESRHADAAFQLLLWLTDPRWSSQVFAASPATTLFRRGQVASPMAWVESNVSPAAAKQYADQTAETLSRRQFLASLRLPGRDDYLAALDEAVRAAVRGEREPAAALKAAADKWREINRRLGVEQQRVAYMHSLGLP